ncbi:MAG: ParA family protein, partial [Clostridia bacterium]|nr:ParA family protein [Clostridia bacterium]
MPSYDRLLVASSKGGVGKSTTALGLAAEFARLGNRVLLADLDSTSRSLDMLTGAEDRALFTFADLFGDTEPGKIAVVPWDGLPGLSLIPAVPARTLRTLCEEEGMTAEALIRNGVEKLLGWEDGYDVL